MTDRGRGVKGAAVLAVIGAGPKAAALAARVAAIRTWRSRHPERAAELRPPPELHIFERSMRAGAHWLGEEGYTDGAQEVCTPPELDLVYPEGSLLGSVLDLAPFAWRTFAAAHGISVARPTHRQLATYVAWALDAAVAAAGGSVALHTSAEVIGVQREGARWRIALRGTEIERARALSLRFDGVVVTSPGPPLRRFHVDPAVADRVTDARDYWSGHRAAIRESIRSRQRIAVVGAGGAAAAICADALRAIGPETQEPGGIVLIAPQATLFTRGESRFETEVLTQAEAWRKLPREARRQVAEHLLSGVVFRRVLDELEGLAYAPAFFVGRAIAAVSHESGGVALWCLTLDDRPTLIEVDRAIDASGFDPLWFTGLLEEPARTIVRRLGAPVLAEHLDASLRLVIEAPMFDDETVRESLIPAEPGLHVPFLAGGARPPGRASLLQLGSLADEILLPYLA